MWRCGGLMVSANCQGYCLFREKPSELDIWSGVCSKHRQNGRKWPVTSLNVVKVEFFSNLVLSGQNIRATWLFSIDLFPARVHWISEQRQMTTIVFLNLIRPYHHWPILICSTANGSLMASSFPGSNTSRYVSIWPLTSRCIFTEIMFLSSYGLYFCQKKITDTTNSSTEEKIISFLASY